MQQAQIMRNYMAKLIPESFDRDKIIATFRKYFVYTGKLSVNENGKIDVTTCQKRKDASFAQFPVAFNIATGSFSCIAAGVESLEGSPKSIGKDFICTGNNLPNLVGCPVFVGGSFICVASKLQSLQGCPENIPGDFECSRNNLVSLRFGPKYVGGNYSCEKNPLQTLEHMPLTVGGYVKISWSKNLPLLRLVKYDKVYIITHKGLVDDLHDIFKKYCNKNSSRKDIIACQKDLIDAGFDGNASW